jgi:hypothetical protein
LSPSPKYAPGSAHFPVGTLKSAAAPSAASFDNRADFETAWRVFLSKRTEADFKAWREQRDWAARKYAAWDVGKRTLV